MTDPFAGKAAWFDKHYGSVRGRVRLSLVLARLLDALPEPPARILDVGGGTGAYAIPLARLGYNVTVADRSPEWLDRCRDNARAAGVELDLRELAVADLATARLGTHDAVLCHAVLMYVDRPASVLRDVRTVIRRGGLLSLLEKNRDGIALRPGLNGAYSEARRLLRERVARGRMDIENRAYSIDEWLGMLQEAGWVPADWVGVRLFSDSAPDDLAANAFNELLDLERDAGRTDPYRRIARLVHVLARNAMSSNGG